MNVIENNNDECNRFENVENETEKKNEEGTTRITLDISSNLIVRSVHPKLSKGRDSENDASQHATLVMYTPHCCDEHVKMSGDFDEFLDGDEYHAHVAAESNGEDTAALPKLRYWRYWDAHFASAVERALKELGEGGAWERDRDRLAGDMRDVLYVPRTNMLKRGGSWLSLPIFTKHAIPLKRKIAKNANK